MFARIMLCAVLGISLPAAALGQVPGRAAPPAVESPRLFSSQGGKYPDGFTGQYRYVYELVARRYVNMEAARTLKPYEGKIATAQERDRRIKELLAQIDDRWLKFRSGDDLVDAGHRFDLGLVSPGFHLDYRDGGWVVSIVFARTAAEKAGLRPGDRIVSIDGNELTAAMNQSQIDWTVGNFPGTEVEVEYLAPGAKEKSAVQLTYAAYDNTVVAVTMLPGKVLFVKVTTFMNFNLLNEFAREVAKAARESDGQIAGIVLDLRGNTGGYMDLAFEFAGAFIAKGEFCRTVGRDGRVLHETTHSALPYLPELLNPSADNVKLVNALYKAPMVVLTNGSTMSAAEMLTSALKDCKRATIVGEQTWGKAASFHTLAVAGGELQLVTGRFAGPSGYDHGRRGISPHKVVVQPRNPDGDPQLEAAVVALKTAPFQPVDEERAAKNSDALLLVWGPVVAGCLLLACAIGLGVHLATRRSRKSPVLDPKPDFSWIAGSSGDGDVQVADVADGEIVTGAALGGTVPTGLRERDETLGASLLEPDEFRFDDRGEVCSKILPPDSHWIGAPCHLCGKKFAAGDDINHHTTSGGCSTYCVECIEKV